ncbi:class I SAM-dependent methyltransferase [bacterium]|nr:class I SAM-dependent methyltransferase [bacterium]
MSKTEFYEIAVEQGFYGLEKSGLFGKKDNVRKYWEDIFIKLSVRQAVENLLNHKEKIRIVDLGCGSGEGYKLLTHIPSSSPISTVEKEFVLSADRIECYTGLDISPAMIQQGRFNYKNRNNVKFIQADLSEDFPLVNEPAYDIYFSSYCSLSHLTYNELKKLFTNICSHIDDTAVMVFDVFGRYSPEWPIYWDKDCYSPLPYNMAYLLPPEEQIPDRVEWFEVTYWNTDELVNLIVNSAVEAGRKAQIEWIKDRSIFVGRHMDNNFFKAKRHKIRSQVNRLFDRDYRGNMAELHLDLSYLEEKRESYPAVWERISTYAKVWKTVINLIEALINLDNKEVKRIIESSSSELSEELKMLAWIYRNAERFPVLDFWASVIGPQVACVLRNLELSFSTGLGCGHSISCLVRITK